MREIKFRAWDGKRIFVPAIHHSGYDLNELLYSFDSDGVKLMQYTGLKDKNGMEIYEGDILQRASSINSDYHGEWIRDEVIHKPGQWFSSHVSSEKGKLPRGYTAGPLLDSYFDYDGKLYAFGKDYEPACTGEVIGNIYENPELLEAKND